MRKVNAVGAGGLLAGLAATVAIAAPGASTGPSSSDPPYVVRSEPGIVTKSIITVGTDTADNGYGMVGIPDGLGAYDNNDGTFTVLMNHELPRRSAGVVRAHGAVGAFVSKWRIQKGSLRVLEGSDLIQNVATWNAGTNSYNAPAKGHCDRPALLGGSSGVQRSTTLPPARGTTAGSSWTARKWAPRAAASARPSRPAWRYELPALGKMSFENSPANPDTGDKTVVVSLDDSTPGQVYVYAGDKSTSVESRRLAAGLTNGKLYGIKVAGVPLEFGKSDWAVGDTLSFSGVEVSGATGAALDADSKAKLVTDFERPEDGAWDPRNPSDFYFVTTSNIVPASGRSGHTRLWRLRFTDPANPSLGGSIKLLVNGPASALSSDPDETPGPRMFDNMTVDDRGRVLIQEDTGETPYRGRLWLYEIALRRADRDRTAHHRVLQAAVSRASSRSTRSPRGSSRRPSSARGGTSPTCRRIRSTPTKPRDTHGLREPPRPDDRTGRVRAALRDSRSARELREQEVSTQVGGGGARPRPDHVVASIALRSSLTKSANASGPASATWTARDPTTTPSASEAASAACSGVEMPKPA